MSRVEERWWTVGVRIAGGVGTAAVIALVAGRGTWALQLAIAAAIVLLLALTPAAGGRVSSWWAERGRRRKVAEEKEKHQQRSARRQAEAKQLRSPQPGGQHGQIRAWLHGATLSWRTERLDELLRIVLWPTGNWPTELRITLGLPTSAERVEAYPAGRRDPTSPQYWRPSADQLVIVRFSEHGLKTTDHLFVDVYGRGIDRVNVGWEGLT